MILSLCVVGGALAFLASLVFTLAVFALPCFVGMTAGMLAYAAGAGAFGAMLAGFSAAMLSFALGQWALATARVMSVRLLIVTIYVVPASLAGFGLARSVAGITGANPVWGIAICGVGAAATAAAALARLVALPDGAGLDGRPQARPVAAQRR